MRYSDFMMMHEMPDAAIIRIILDMHRQCPIDIVADMRIMFSI